MNRSSAALIAASCSLAACGLVAFDGAPDGDAAADGAPPREAGGVVDATVLDGGRLPGDAADASLPDPRDAAGVSDAGDAGHDVTCATPVEPGQMCRNSLIYPYYCSTATSTCGCVPGCGETRRTCAELDASCGQVPDGTGGLADCGACPAQEQCVQGRCTAADAACVPVTCVGQAVECGVVSDGCGGILFCSSTQCSFWACVPSDPRCPDPHPMWRSPDASCPEGLVCPVPVSTCCTGAQKCVGGVWVQEPVNCPP